MTPTSLALALFAAIATLALTIVAFQAWGAPVMVPVLLLAALVIRWAMSPVSYDDGHP